MTNPWQTLLTVGPLGLYLGVIAFWQSGRRPKVVRGLVDHALLMFGVGGLALFGPFGQAVLSWLFRTPQPSDRLMLFGLLGLLATSLSRGALARLVVYHVEPSRLLAALEAALGKLNGRFVKTLDGYEDKTTARSLRVEFTRWVPCAVVQARGPDAERLIQALRPRLVEKLRDEVVRRSSIAWILYACSVAVMVAPFVAVFLSQPRNREAMRVLLERLRGG